MNGDGSEHRCRPERLDHRRSHEDRCRRGKGHHRPIDGLQTEQAAAFGQIGHHGNGGRLDCRKRHRHLSLRLVRRGDRQTDQTQHGQYHEPTQTGHFPPPLEHDLLNDDRNAAFEALHRNNVIIVTPRSGLPEPDVSGSPQETIYPKRCGRSPDRATGPDRRSPGSRETCGRRFRSAPRRARQVLFCVRATDTCPAGRRILRWRPAIFRCADESAPDRRLR